MKKLLKITVVLFTVSLSAQHYGTHWNKRDKSCYGFISTGIDVRNALIGSKPTDNQPALDVQFKLGARTGALEVSMFYENFNRIDFKAYGVNINGVFELHKNFDVALGGELGSIIREENSNFLMCGVNSELRYDLKQFVVGLQMNNRYRGDLKKYGNDLPIVNSVVLNFYYK